MKTQLSLLFVACGVCLHAGAIYTDLGSSDSYLTPGGLGIGGGNSGLVGTQFTATATGNLMQILAPIDDSIGQVTLDLYVDSGGLPGTLLESWSNFAVGTDLSTIPLSTVTSVVQPLLTAGDKYWFLVSFGSDVVEWGESSTIATGGMWSSFNTSTANLTPIYTSGPPLAIELDATTVSGVPEPETFGLLAAGLLAIWRVRSARRDA